MHDTSKNKTLQVCASMLIVYYKNVNLTKVLDRWLAFDDFCLISDALSASCSLQAS